jgi:hypothetical protein
MDVETGPNTPGSDAAADAAFLEENVDISYLKETIDMGLVDSLLGEFAPTQEPTAEPAAPPESGLIMEPKEEQSIVQRIKSLWRGTDKNIAGVNSKISNLLHLHEKAREVRALKREYEESVSKKLGK